MRAAAAEAMIPRMPFTILIVDDEREMCLSLSEIFSSFGFRSAFTTDPLAVAALIQGERADLIVMDIRMPQIAGIDLLKQIKARDSSLPVIMITGYPSIENAVESMRYGALNVFVKPLKIKELMREVEQIRAHRALAAPEKEDGLIVTGDPGMRKLLAEVQRVAATDAPVLITGESGTGKELAANAIHAQSPRRGAPFVKLNCAAIPDTLLESELFGHERGAFTGAIRRHTGKLEIASRGTIFFDEIADMSASTQPKLLRVLQDGEFTRLGGTETLRTQARLVAATNRDTAELLEGRVFREDLFYRLSVVSVHMPALRDRAEDIDVLADHFVRRFCRKYGKDIREVSPPVRELLHRHSWPGNVRELKNCLERAVIFCDGPLLTEEHLPAQYLKIREQGYPAAGGCPRAGRAAETPEAVFERLTREKIRDALASTHGEKQRAAEILHISRKTLYNRMKKLGMQ